MTREVGDILIQEVLDHKEYEVERKIKLIEKIEKLVMASLNVASNVVNYTATREQDIDAATEELNKGKSVREVVRETGISYRRVAEASKRIKEEDKEIDEVNKTLPLIKPENIVTETDNASDNTTVTESDNASDNALPTRNVTKIETTISDEARAREILAPLTGLKKAATAAAIQRYLKDRATFEANCSEGMQFAYTMDDYVYGNVHA